MGCISLYLLLVIWMSFSSSTPYIPAPSSAALPHVSALSKPSAKKEWKQKVHKKKLAKKKRKFRFGNIFRALGTFLGIVGLVAALLSPLLLYIFFPHIATWAFFLTGMVSAALLSFFSFVLVFGSYKMFWLILSLLFAGFFLACFVGLLLTLPLLASLIIIGVLLLLGISSIFI